MTPDDDFDLGDLKTAWEATTPRPDPSVKAAHRQLAQENCARLQGAGRAARPMTERPQGGVWMGVRNMMNALTSRGALTASTALVACGFLVLTPVGREVWTRGERLVTPETPTGPGTAAPEPVSQPEASQGVAEVGPTAKVPPGPAGEVAATRVAPTAGAAPEAATLQVADDAGAALAEREVAPAADTRLDATGPAQAGAADGLVARQAAPLAPPSEYGNALADEAPPQVMGEAESYAAAPAPMVAPMAPPSDVMPVPEPDTEAFSNEAPNPLKITAEEPVSTFSIDVDTASYGVVRQSLMSGALPPPEAVRVEEMVNYFPYDYAAPEPGEGPFHPTVSVMPTPWNPDTRLVTIGLQGEMPAVEDRPPLNLVFLIDTSGSMEDASKLPLLKQSFRLMVDQLRPEDQVAIVTYAGSAGLVLPPTPAGERQAILKSLNGLMAGGSTNGQGGLEQAYDVVEGMAQDGEVSRVILATDGDFNVGLSDPTALEDYIAERRETGAFLSVLGFGRGNLDDATMQALAQNGNGQAAYIDSLSEAQKVLVDQLTGELFPIAQDVKVQVEWNPATVAEYRLIGYETRALRREDFNNDRVDAGELGAGHSVTAIYEVTPVGSPAQLSDPLRYQPEVAAAEPGGPTAPEDELGFLRLRWKEPGGTASELRETPITGQEAAGTEAHFAAAVAGWGQLLRGGDYLGDWG
ncbi:MAG TPA: von Willebrand factor type A domain-containing protein, partial [Rubellimicrobium sp.]|nr:von Willebrand factor type A domain-containing protein [Rubellimicrobium sp.]